MRARTVTANDELLLPVGAVLYPCSRSLAGFIDRIDSFADKTNTRSGPGAPTSHAEAASLSKNVRIAEWEHAPLNRPSTEACRRWMLGMYVIR